MKSEISPLIAKFCYFNIAVNVSDVILLNSEEVMYLLWSGVSFLPAVRAVGVAKLVILDVSFLTSFILALRAMLVAKLKISDILLSISLVLALCTSSLTTSLFTTSLSLLK